MSPVDRKLLMQRVTSLVVKVGTNVLSDRSGKLDHRRIETICAQVHVLRGRGLKVAVVSSGAIGAGMAELGMKKRPTTLPELQAAAAVGQSHLILAYDEVFRKHGYHAGQVLLTREDVNDRVRYLNARNAIHAILAHGAVPVINENDTISVDEITFGDNDYLAATVTNLLRADLLVLLTSVEGLLTPLGEVVPLVEAEDEKAKGYSREEKSPLGKGGMSSKLEAADIARAAGEMVVIASGLRDNVLVEIIEGRPVGTLLLPSEVKLSARARWIGFGARPGGTLVIDEGAVKALVERGKSLLPSGVVAVQGEFEKGAVVNVASKPGGKVVARGLVNYNSREAARIAGHKSSEIASLLGSCPYAEIVHRDNLVIL